MVRQVHHEWVYPWVSPLGVRRERLYMVVVTMRRSVLEPCSPGNESSCNLIVLNNIRIAPTGKSNAVFGWGRYNPNYQ